MGDELLSQIIDYATTHGTGDPRRLRLPTERAIAEALGLNRTTLRESMAVLEALGFLHRKQGSGTFLTLPGADFQRLYFETALRLGHITTADLEAARELLEIQIVQIAAEHATAEDLKTLEVFLQRLITTRDGIYGLELDFAFHLHLGACTHNPVVQMLLESLSNALRTVLRERRALVGTLPGGVAETDQTHVGIFEAVKAHDPARARKAMLVHFGKWREYAGRAAARRVAGRGTGKGGAKGPSKRSGGT